MKITIAIIDKKEYILPDGKREQFTIRFEGPQAEKMKKLWNSFEAKWRDSIKRRIDRQEMMASNLEEYAERIRIKVEESMPFYRWWHDESEKKMLEEANNYMNDSKKHREEAERIMQEEKEKPINKKVKMEEFLYKNGFKKQENEWILKEV